MGVYAYCLGRAGSPPPADLAGLGDAPVRAESIAGFSVWVSELPAAPVASLAAVRVHNQVVEAATVDATPLPFRFGHWFPSANDLAGSLSRRRARLAAGLDHVDGALEHGIRVLDPAHAPAPADRSSGTAYLEALARRTREDQLHQARGRDVAAAIRERLAPLVRDERVRLVGGGTLAAIAHLVDRHETRNYQRRAAALPPEWPELRLVFSGPWPPYGFVD